MKKIFTLSFVSFLLMMGMVDGQASFTANSTSVCSNNCSSSYLKMTTGCVTFTDNSIGNPTSWQWTFPGGTPATAGIQNPTVCYCQPGNWNVSLHINGPNGQYDTTYVNYIHAGNCPIAQFTNYTSTHHDTICVGKCVDFIDESTNLSDSWQWLFTGASTLTSTAENPENICYDNPGSFTVELIARNVFGWDTSQVQSIIVVECPQPSANFTFNPSDTICVGQCITFTDNSTQGSGPILYIQWSFAGGLPNLDTQASITPCIYYYDTGRYQVTLADSNAFGSDTAIHYITVLTCTGINSINNSNSEISIYPNPTNSAITLSNLRFGIYYLRITDVTGREIYHQPINNSNNTTIDVSDWSNGVYFYQLTNSKETFRGKFVKQ